MKDWPKYMWVIFIGFILLMGAMACYVGYLYYAIGYLKAYAILAVIILAYIVIRTKREKANGRHLHIHHYFLGMIVMTFSCYQSNFVTLLHAIFNGISIEGASRWGYDPIWDKDEEPAQST